MLPLFIAAAPNAGSVWVRVVDKVSGAVFEQEITTDLPAASQFLAPPLFMNNAATGAAVAYDCSGVYVETDYRPTLTQGHRRTTHPPALPLRFP